jgi:hypothetical protein
MGELRGEPANTPVMTEFAMPCEVDHKDTIAIVERVAITKVFWYSH